MPHGRKERKYRKMVLPFTMPNVYFGYI